FGFRGRIAAGSKFVAEPRKRWRVSRLGQSDDYFRRITHRFCGLFWLRALLTRGIMPRKQSRRIAYSARTGSANPKEVAQARADRSPCSVWALTISCARLSFLDLLPRLEDRTAQINQTFRAVRATRRRITSSPRTAALITV